ncbi:MAG: energy-coupling factor transporter transmembrane component T [Myxococcota bacterium]|nr:energy-coupling factor transporter transmembrane component T [Myxococcota bacterium]
MTVAGPGGGAGGAGPSRALDPRAAVLTAVAYVVFVASFPKYSVAALAPMAAVPVVAAALSGMPLRLLLRRLALGAPFAVLVGIANPFLDARPYAVAPGVEIAAGWISFATIAAKFLLSVSVLVVLVHAVPVQGICRALRALRAPLVLVAQIDLLHRYLRVLAAEGAAMRRARDLRGGGSRRARGGSVAAAMLAVLLRRTLQRGERVHRAMLARGFDGEIRLAGRMRWRPVDTAATVGVVAFCAAARFLPVVEWVGGTALG